MKFISSLLCFFLTVCSFAQTDTGGVVFGFPVITTQPVSKTALVGAAASFSVKATGTPAPTYQWRKDGVAITGRTAASLNYTAVKATDAGVYTVTVTNTAGSIVSNPAILAVTGTNPPVQPPTQPPISGPVVPSPFGHADEVLVSDGSKFVFKKFSAVVPSVPVSAVVGQTVVLLATAQGVEPMTYQWFKDDQALAGETKASLAINNAQISGSGTYSVVVSNGAGQTASGPFVLTVK